MALDRVEGLGEFVEVETIDEDASADSRVGLGAVQQAVADLGNALGLTEIEPRSYLRMVLEDTSREPERRVGS